MKTKLSLTIVLCLMLGALLFVGAPASRALADTNSINFESYSTGNINGQDGWSKTGSFDVAVVNNGYGYASFGAKSLRMSDSVTSGTFGDQTYVKPLVNAVGEADATAGSFSVGTIQKHFEMQFDIASTLPTLQAGMHVSVSPDRGDGSRMSYLRFEDQSDGIHVFFDDVADAGPVGTVATFNETDIATVTRSPHTIKLTMDVVDGPGNDVVKVWIDGVLKITGTSWENYYRYDPEAAGEQSPRIVKTVEFRESGTATPADAGNGFLVDNLSLKSSVPGSSTVVVTQSNTHGWFFYDDDFPGGIGNFVTGPATPPLGTGSVHYALPHNPNADAAHQPRQALTTLAYAGTRLSDITNLQYSTYRSQLATGNESIYLQFDVDYNATDASFNYQGRLVFVPSFTDSVPQNTWQTWTPMTAGKWYASNQTASGGQCSQGSPCTWTQVLANWPNAGIMANTGWLHLKAGGPADGFDGNMDDFVIGINGANTTYNFENDGTTALQFVPDSAKVGVGGTTYIAINVNNITNMFGYQFAASYDASKVTATAWFADAPPPGFPPFHFFVSSSPASIPGSWAASCGSGTCQFAVSHVAPQTAVTGSGPVAIIALTGTNPGTFTMSFSNDILSDVDGGGITHTNNTATITVYGYTTVSGVVNLQGRANRVNTGTVTLTDLGGNFPPVIATFSAADGTYSFSNVPALPGGSNYQFDAAHSLYLTNEQTHTLTPGTPYTAPTTTLRGGDANNDATISVLDLSCIGGSFGGGAATCGATGSTDINADTFTNILDLVLVGGNYGLASPQPW